MNYRIQTVERDAQWIAYAERLDTGDRFGIECAAASRDEARSRLTAWLAWQEEHAAALAALQQAERDYHRTIASRAFANPSDGPSAVELQRDALERIEAARIRLDEIRAARPE